jgi:hypothetical protein
VDLGTYDKTERLRSYVDEENDSGYYTDGTSHSSSDQNYHSESDHDDHDDHGDEPPQIPLGLNLFYIGIWILALTIFGYYLSIIIGQYKDAVANPRSSVRIVKEHEMEYPKVTICNFNHFDLNSTDSCTFCDISLEDCFVRILDIASVYQ